jgi:hypothetical protein
MFNVGDKIYVREDLDLNKEDFAETDYLGAQGVVIDTREITWSSRDDLIIEVMLDGDPHPKAWYSVRLAHVHKEPDWEV